MNIEINPDYEKATTLRALSAFLTLLADEADGSTKDAAILSAIVQKGLNHTDEHLKAHKDAIIYGTGVTLDGKHVPVTEFLDKPSEALKAVEEHLAALNATQAAPLVVKRTRRPKAEMAADAVEPGNVSAAVTEAATPSPTEQSSSAAAAASDSTSAEHTIDDVRAALQRYTAVHGMPDGIALLKNYGAGRISELGLEQYPLFIAECDAPAQEAA